MSDICIHVIYFDYYHHPNLSCLVLHCSCTFLESFSAHIFLKSCPSFLFPFLYSFSLIVSSCIIVFFYFYVICFGFYILGRICNICLSVWLILLNVIISRLKFYLYHPQVPGKLLLAFEVLVPVNHL